MSLFKNTVVNNNTVSAIFRVASGFALCSRIILTGECVCFMLSFITSFDVVIDRFKICVDKPQLNKSINLRSLNIGPSEFFFVSPKFYSIKQMQSFFEADLKFIFNGYLTHQHKSGPSQTEDDEAKLVAIAMAARGFFGGYFFPPHEKDKIVITPRAYGKEGVSVSTMHISCKSDMFHPSHNYGGVIVYQYDGKSEWKTANNTHCKSGYIVIQDTDKEDVKKWKNESGVVHRAVYRNAFGESLKAEVVGEGIGLSNSKCVQAFSTI